MGTPTRRRGTWADPVAVNGDDAVALRRRHLFGRMERGKARILCGRNRRRPRQGRARTRCSIFRREDGVAENFHTAQNRELLQKLADETGGRYYSASNAGRLSDEISYSEAGITRAKLRTFGICPPSFCWRCCCEAPNGCCAAAGGSYDLWGRHAAAAASQAALLALKRFVARRAGLRAPRRLRACPTWLLLLLTAASLHATTYYLTVTGLGGEPDYEQHFAMWAKDIDKALKPRPIPKSKHWSTPPANRCAPRSRHRQTAKPQDALVVMLIGHGRYDGYEYKINLPGPDLAATELAALLTVSPPPVS